MRSHSSRRLRSLLVLALLLGAALVGCGPSGPVTLMQLARCGHALSAFMATADRLSADTRVAVTHAYAEIEHLPAGGQALGAQIVQMEQRAFAMTRQADSLARALSYSRRQADHLFDLMERRAEENETPDLQDRMVARTEAQRERFDRVLDVAEDRAAAIEQAVQRYDDIVGYLQVHASLGITDEVIADVQAITFESNRLHDEIQEAIREGRAQINSMLGHHAATS
ncbi:MAG: hypothetical protein AAFN13_16455 [Bacteroidota bacterium]